MTIKNTISDILFENTDENTDEMNEIYDVINGLTPDDVGREEWDHYILRYEGFSDMCNADVERRMTLDPSDPYYLEKYEDVFPDVLDDWKARENKQHIESGLSGDECNPIIWAIYRR